MRSGIQKAKVILTFSSLCMLAVLIIWPLMLQEGSQPIPKSVLKDGSEEDEETHMLKPKMLGVDSQGNPFTITADKAIQEHENLVTLLYPKADITNEQKWYIGSSGKGEYNLSSKRLELYNEVYFYNDAGYEMHAERLTILPTHRVVHTNQPVEISGANYQLSADTMQSSNDASYIAFHGNVRFMGHE